MTVLTMRLIKSDFIVTGPDIEPMKFKSRSEARDLQGAPFGSPITEIGPGGKRWQPRNRQSDRAGEARSARRDRIWARKSAQSEIAPAARAESTAAVCSSGWVLLGKFRYHRTEPLALPDGFGRPSPFL